MTGSLRPEDRAAVIEVMRCEYYGGVERMLDAAFPLIIRAVADELSREPIITELRELWQRALEREGNLASAVADVVQKATQYGTTEDGDTYAYLVPKGAMHRLVGVAQSNGTHIPVSFRNDITKEDQ